MAGPFCGKVALVTGGSSGIGRAAALAFARNGAQVAIADIDAAGAEHTLDLIETLGSRPTFVQTDVSQASQVENMVSKTVDAYGRLDFAFNNAGILGKLGPLTDTTEQTWDQVTGIHLKGTFLCLKYELRHMLTQGRGTIVNNSSIMGLVGSSTGCAYVASKHGILGLTKVAALECAKTGIRVNAVCPGFIDTPIVDLLTGGDAERRSVTAARHPLGRLGTAEEVAEAVIWLCSESASFITGHALPVDGGYVAV